MEIQKAGEFADDYRERMVANYCWPMAGDALMTASLTAMVRARDKAIIERCKEAIEKSRPKCIEEDGQISYAGFIPDNCIAKALDSILRDLD